jgi:putative cell wall-binding protein
MSSRSLRPSGRKMSAAVLSATLGLAGLGLAATPVAADTVDTVTDDCGRLAGQTRFGTAGAIADAYDAESPTDHAIVANGFNFPDALAASALGRELNAPVLLVNQDSVPLETASALQDLGIVDVTIVGGTAAVGQGVEDALAEDYTVDREAGNDRYETARDIALAIAEVGQLDGLNTAIIATGNNYPDALAGGPVAYHGDGTNPFPILLTNGSEIPAATQEALDAHSIEQVIVLGGTDAVPASVVAELATSTGNAPIVLAGTTREGTAQDVADFAVAELGFAPDAVLLADGREIFPSPDALSGGPLGGVEMAPILLVNPGMPAETEAFITENADAITQVIALGGTVAVPTEVLNAGCEAGGVPIPGETTTNQSFGVTPAEAAENTVSTGATTSEGARAYTVDVGDATVVDIALFPAENVSVDEDGVVTIDPNTQVADGTGVSIEVVNGVSNVAAGPAAGDAHVNNVAPASGTVTFTIDSVVADSVVPVVFTDADNDNVVDLDTTTDQPTEAFGIGGVKTWIPAEATTGDVAGDQPITGVNKDLDRFTTANATYFYDAGDRFFVDAGETPCADPTNEVLIAEFEAQLSVGDDLDDATFYQANEGLQSTFCLEDTAPAAPGVAATGDQGNVDLDITPPTGFDSDDTITLQRATVDDGVDNICGGLGAADDVVGAYATVATLTAASDEDTTTPAVIDYTDTVAPGCYSYRAAATVDGESSDNSTPVTAQSTADTTPPTMASATPNDVNDGTGTTNQVVVTFSESVTILDASKITVHPAGQPGLIFTVTGAAPANANNTAYVLTLSGSLNDAAADVTYQVDSAAGAYEDTSGNDNVAEDPDTTFVY